MKIGVVSDTHSLDLPQQLVEDFHKVDLIIHVGDFCSEKELKFFQNINDVKAVYGNMDDAKLQKNLSCDINLW